MSFRALTFVIALILAAAVPRSLAAETLRIASPQRGSWEGAIPELGKEAGIFQRQGLDLDILYTQGGGETLQIVVSGAVDIGLSAGTLGTLGAYAKGAPVRIIAASSTGSREVFWFVPAASPLKSMHDANGHSIAGRPCVYRSSMRKISRRKERQWDATSRPITRPSIGCIRARTRCDATSRFPVCPNHRFVTC